MFSVRVCVCVCVWRTSYLKVWETGLRNQWGVHSLIFFFRFMMMMMMFSIMSMCVCVSLNLPVLYMVWGEKVHKPALSSSLSLRTARRHRLDLIHSLSDVRSSLSFSRSLALCTLTDAADEHWSLAFFCFNDHIRTYKASLLNLLTTLTPPQPFFLSLSLSRSNSHH